MDRNYLFRDGHLSSLAHAQPKLVQEFVDKFTDAEIASSSTAQLYDRVCAEFHIEKLVLAEGAATRSNSDIKMEVDDYGRRLTVNGTRIEIGIPFNGDPELWKLQPSTWRSTCPHGGIDCERGAMEGTLHLSIDAHDHEDADSIKRKYDSLIDDVRFYIGHQGPEIETMNRRLQSAFESALAIRKARIAKRRDVGSLLGIPEAPVHATPMVIAPRTDRVRPKVRLDVSHLPKQFDVFISHASEDKEAVVRPLADALVGKGLSVWYDDLTLTVGDSLRRKIDDGLARSRFGIVVLSPSFFAKQWPQRELDGLVAKESNGQKVILPVWHSIDYAEILGYSPTLADRLAVRSSIGIDQVVAELLRAIER